METSLRNVPLSETHELAKPNPNSCAEQAIMYIPLSCESLRDHAVNRGPISRSGDLRNWLGTGGSPVGSPNQKWFIGLFPDMSLLWWRFRHKNYLVKERSWTWLNQC